MKALLIKSVGAYYNILSYLSKPYAADKALSLFIRPRKGRINEEQSDFLGTAYQEELKYNNFPIMTYRWLGSKKTILLAHGWESNAARWKQIVLDFRKKGYNIVALDAPAHGKSGSTDFNAILYSEFINVVAKRFQPEIILGHSIGGMACVFFQNKYQMTSIQKMILLGSPSEFKDVVKRYTVMLGYNARLTNQLNNTINVKFGERPEAYSTADYSKNITSKALIIHDEEDAIIPYNDAILIRNNFKNSTLITTKGLGHSLIHESVSMHINDFIEA